MDDINNSILTEIEINATPDQVWSVFSDWKHLKDWSSTFIGISVDQPVRGERFISYFKNPLIGGVFELDHVCTDYEEGSKFGWSGNIIGKINDHHIYYLEPTPLGTTLFKQEDGFHGPHSTLLKVISRHHVLAMYNKFNLELKNRVESIYQSI